MAFATNLRHVIFAKLGKKKSLSSPNIESPEGQKTPNIIALLCIEVKNNVLIVTTWSV